MSKARELDVLEIKAGVMTCHRTQHCKGCMHRGVEMWFDLLASFLGPSCLLCPLPFAPPHQLPLQGSWAAAAGAGER